jgi:hypothetical protein
MKNKYLLMWINNLFDQLKRAKVFSKNKPEIRVLPVID